MKNLLSLPPNVVGSFHEVTGLSREAFYVTSDPAGRKLGSGGGTAWLLASAHADEAPEGQSFEAWLGEEKRVLLHAGGQSRRLPAYAPSGKVLTPIPVFRWARGQRIDQTLLDLQMPLYREMLDRAPKSLKTLIASGDVYLRATEPLQAIPDADVVCYGLWADPRQASHHGVFMMNRQSPTALDFMLQKPTPEQQARLMPTHLLLMDIGVWLLSDKAVLKLMRKTQAKAGADRLPTPGGHSLDVPSGYDLYSEFGCALGLHPSLPDADLSDLKVAILPLPGGEFYHYGTGTDMIRSSVAIQNLVKDQRYILQMGVKPQTSVFTQNAAIANHCTPDNLDVWVENSYLSAGWHLSQQNIVTGIPENDWKVTLPKGVCIDIVPIGEKGYALRPYGFDDAFRGDVGNSSTAFLGRPMSEWMARHGVLPSDLFRTDDLQAARLFPVSEDLSQLERLLHWFLDYEPANAAEMAELWRSLPRYAADELSIDCNLPRLFAQRKALQARTLPLIAKNWERSVCYQLNLKDLAEKFAEGGFPLPAPLPEDAQLMTRIHDAMFRSEVLRATDPQQSTAEEAKAFGLLREGLTENVLRHKSAPRKTTFDDQIVWGRSSVRIDVAGGWTDTPPYSLVSGGNVVNLAIEMNGQPPLQVYVKPCKEPVVICRSIDLGAMERIETYEELRQYNKVGSPFSIPKAALTLAGFLPGFGAEEFPTLRRQLEAFGCGLEITLLAAIPAGSGLGTSSILAATVLGALSDFCGLGWDKNEVCNRTLVLEQLLTTGGGWQDQYGGVLPGVKLLQTGPGFDQNAVARRVPDTLFTDPTMHPCHLLYYTGVTRTAKHILAEIVRGMFLNNTRHLDLLGQMKQHALTVFDALQMNNLECFGRLVRETWQQNKALDAGTNPAIIEALCRRVDDLCYGYKLPGAGGGGFMYMVAKDPEAARRIRRMLQDKPLTPNSRFVEMSVSRTGLQVSRS